MRREDRRCLLFLAALVALFFLPVFAGRVVSPADLLFGLRPWEAHAPPGFERPSNELLSDQVFAFYPAFVHNRADFAAGRVSLWNPDLACGLPSLASAQSQTLCPFSIPLYLLPIAWGITVSDILVLLAGAFGAYALFRSWELARFASLFGAIAFTFSGFLVVWLGHPHARTAVWLPLLFLTAGRLLETGERRFAAWLGVATAFCLYGGHPPTSFQCILATMFYFAGMALATWSQSWDGLRLRDRASRAGLFVFGVASGFLLWAPLGIPFSEYLRLSISLRVRSAWSEPSPSAGLSGMLSSFLMPDIYGRPTGGLHFYWRPENNFNELNGGYIGTIGILAALSSLFLLIRQRRARPGVLAALFIVATTVAYHVFPVYDLAAMLPGVRMMAVMRFLSVSSFAAAGLAAFFIDHLERSGAGRRGRAWPAVLALGVAVALPAIVLLDTDSAARFHTWAAAHPGEAGSMKRLMHRDAIRFAVMLALFAIVVLGTASTRMRWRHARPWLAGGLIAELFMFGFGYNPFIPPARVFPSTPLTDFLNSTPRGEGRLLGLDRVMLTNLGSAYGVQEVRGMDGMEIARYTILLETAAATSGGLQVAAEHRSPLLDYLNVRWMVSDYPLLESREPFLPGGALPPLGPGDRATQTFRAAANGLDGVFVQFRTFGRRNRCEVRWRLVEEGAPERDVGSGSVPAGTIYESSYVFLPVEPIAASAGRRYRLEVTSSRAGEGDAVSLWVTLADSAADDDLSWNGVERTGEDLCHAPHYDDDRLEPHMVDGLIVSENRRALPRAFMVRRALVAADSMQLFDAVSSMPESLAERCVLEHPVPGLDTMDADALPAMVSIRRYQSNEVEVAVSDNRSPGILVTSETWHPGWRVSVDGREAELLRVNYTFRGVFLDRGDHVVRFRYAPESFHRGVAAAAVGLAAVMALLAPSRRGLFGAR